MSEPDRVLFGMTTGQMNVIRRDRYLIRRVYESRNYEQGKWHRVDSIFFDEFFTKCGKFMKLDTGSKSAQKIEAVPPSTPIFDNACKNCFPRSREGFPE